MKYEKGTFTTVPNKEALRGLDPQAQVLFMWLCAYADGEGVCFPSISRLAEDCGMAERTVDARIKLLESEGFIEKINRTNNGKKTSNEYQSMIVSTAGDADLDAQELRHSTAGDALGSTAGDAHKLYPVLTKPLNSSESTPAQKAEEFFTSQDKQSEIVAFLISKGMSESLPETMLRSGACALGACRS
jgi:DNA-binding transcriptional MocR family regulator